MSTPRPEDSGDDLVFRGEREVVLLGGRSRFRALPVQDDREVWFHGHLLGEDPTGLPQSKACGDVPGRFLLVSFEPSRRRVEVAGDRYGFVPLYHATVRDRLYLSTELADFVRRGLLPAEPDPIALGDFLAFQLALGPRTCLSGVSTLESGRSLSVDLDSLEIQQARSFDLAARLRDGKRPYAEVEEQLIELFIAAHERCLGNADRVGLTLSGGMDTRCLLAATLHLGYPAKAYHVSVPGSRAERYAGLIAQTAQVPFEAHPLDRAFPPRYYALLSRVVEQTEAMKFVPQPEMLWLRDVVDEDSVVLHGAFGEIAKLDVLRDYHFDEAVLGASRDSLAEVLWRRYESRWRSNLRVFDPGFRESLGDPRERLHRVLAAYDANLGVPEVLQLLYFDEFMKSARYGHQLWNERVAIRFPFADPAWVDALLGVRFQDRVQQRFQPAFLERVRPDLAALPDENTGTRAAASPRLQQLVRAMDLARIALLRSSVEANHGDLVAWLAGMQPSPEAVLEEAGHDPAFDSARVAELAASVRRGQRRFGPARALALRPARRDAQALQTFLWTRLSWRWLEGLGHA
ncbi:MAG: hypothetical protein ABFS46_07440 [Myxococcota bacterium]